MSVTYSLYRPNFTSQDTSTRAEIAANEGLLAASAGSPAKFTFDVPDGLWAFARVIVTIGSATIGSGSAVNIPILLSSDMSGSGGTGTTHKVLGNASSPYVLGDTFPSSADGIDGYDPAMFSLFPLDGLTAGTVSGYPYFVSLAAGVSGASVTVEINESAAPQGASLSGISAVMGLQSITPFAPYADFSGQADPGGPPYTGEAFAHLPVTYGLIGPTPDGTTPNGLPPLSYEWQISGASLIKSFGTSPLPGDLSNSWSFPSLQAQRFHIGEVDAYITLTNSPYPHQVDAPRTGWFGGPFYYTVFSPPVLITPGGSYSLNEDAHRRPAALSPNYAYPPNARINPSGAEATSINGLISNDAGHTYLINFVSDIADSLGTNFGADNPSLLVDRRSNHYRAVYGKVLSGQPSLLLATGILDDRFSQGTGSPAVIAGLSGGLCAAAQHPTDQDYALLIYSDTGTAAAPGSLDLKSACSLDAGATWKPLSTVLPALDLTVTGRPALAWLRNTAVLVYSMGTALTALTSIDRGKSWTQAKAVSEYTPGGTDFHYFCLSLAAHGGQMYLLAFVGDTQAKGTTAGTARFPPQTSPRLFVSGDGGRAWTLRAAEKPGASSAAPEYAVPPPGVLPVIQAPSGLGVSPFSGLLRLDTRYVSRDGGLVWLPS